MLKAFLFGLTIGGVGAWLSMQYHLVRTDEGLVIVPRIYQPPVRSAYVDIRHWSPTMWEHYPELSEAIIKSGRNNLIVPGTGDRPASNSAAEQSRDPLAALTRQAARDGIPDPVSHQPPSSLRNVSGADKVISPGGIPAQLASNRDDLAAAKLSHRMLTEPVPEMSEGLPSLQRPVPVPVPADHAQPQERVASTTPATMSAADAIGSAGVTSPERQDWMRGFLQSLIPRTDPLRDSETQSQARMPQEIATPQPRQNPTAVTSQGDEWDAFPQSPRRLSNTSLKPL